MKGLHTEVTINFMPPGRTKFTLDWCFGLLKRCFRRAEVSCLNDLCDVVRESTPAARVNIPKIVGREDRTVIIPTYDWQAYLSPVFKPLPSIKKLSHFRFSAENNGEVFYKTSLAEEKSRVNLVKDRTAYANLRAMPETIPAPGLTHERQEYLFSHIVRGI